MSTTFFTHLRCSSCNRSYSPHVIQAFCPACNKTLLAEYDLDAARRFLTRDMIQKREGTLWRYRELLPVFDDSNIVSLGEGWTPIIHTEKLGRELGLPFLSIKEEAYNPSGSFKARGLCLAVSKAKELGIAEVAMPSAGNAGGALAAYAAKAEMKAHIFMPNDTPAVNIKEASLYGASVYLVDGNISDAAKKMNERRSATSWFDMSTMKEPYRLEGKKTMGYELAEQFAWKLPDVILYPTGGGTGLIGMWKAFREMETLGWISGKKPRMVSVQTTGCAPIVKAFRERRRESEFWQNAKTSASGLRVPKAFADTLILDALYESGGTAIDVSDSELIREMRHVAALEGIFLCPEGAAAVGALRQLVMQGDVKPADTVVVFNTGSGYKYVELY
ncbi:MAG: threonine synthase [Ignavibacteriae bacterium]|nr:threonine synthase [Ignavibacteria bacterium]MBI3364568.1 threonine synthase [Ignavibacteriota bacterium]